MPARQALRPPHWPFAAVLLGWALAGAAAAVSEGADVAAAPASNPSRNTTMTQNEAGSAFTAAQLKDLVGERTGPLPQPPTLVYGFSQGKQKAPLTLSDGGIVNSAPGPSHWTGPPNHRQTDAGAAFVYREGRHTVREIERREPPARQVVLLLANGIMVTAAGDADMKALKALAVGLPIDADEALVRPAK